MSSLSSPCSLLSVYSPPCVVSSTCVPFLCISPLRVCPFSTLRICLLTVNGFSSVCPLSPLRLCLLSVYVLSCVPLFSMCISSPLSVYILSSCMYPFRVSLSLYVPSPYKSCLLYVSCPCVAPLRIYPLPCLFLFRECPLLCISPLCLCPLSPSLWYICSLI